MKQCLKIVRKEMSTFFASAMAFIFLGAFLAASFFIFFWIEMFFSRNIADVRPLFEWMPILMIFLSAAITMRMWSEERRSGTLEFLLTSPAQPYQLVLGKFIACLCLVAVALVLTLPLPITVSMIGPLDWGPVFGGYVATLFLAAAYIAIGLFVSTRTDNQIVSLIITALICSLLYALGSDAVTGLFDAGYSEIFKLIGTGSRFDAITRGMIDVRDLYFYVSLMGVFLSLNVFELERRRWSGNASNSRHRQWGLLTVLFAANFLAANLWLAPVSQARVDMTKGNIYSISHATENYLERLQEPLLIRGYFSTKTHPLLAPLVPQLHDLLKEYAVSGKGRVRVEFIDPVEEPELEEEAGRKYGINPVPLQFASKYQSSIVNSYFNILIKYGDQFETLGFRDLIDVKMQDGSDVRIELRNPEYEITRAVKKVLFSYQSAGDLFAAISQPVVFKGYISADRRLPKQLVDLKNNLKEVLEELQAGSRGQLSIDIQNPDSDRKLAEKIQSEFGFRPMATSILSSDKFWFYMAFEGDNRFVQVSIPEIMSREAIKHSLEAALKRFSAGFLKTVAMHMPAPPNPRYGIQGTGITFSWLTESLKEEYRTELVGLRDIGIPAETELLMLLSPDQLNEQQLFDVDQFLMKGGTVIVVTAPFSVNLQQGLNAREKNSGLTAWLDHHGLTMKNKLVLDPQNAPFPIPVERDVGGFVVRETHLVDYPFFIDIRADGMDRRNGITTGIDQVTMNWTAPVVVDPDKNKDRRVIRLLESSEKAWSTDETSLQPDFSKYGKLGFPAGKETGKNLLAVVVEGKFTSYFKDKPFPLIDKDEGKQNAGKESKKSTGEEDEKSIVIDRLIEHSPESARIILFASDCFASDIALQLATAGMGTQYLNPVNLLKNVVDWSLEDRNLLSIRGRSHFSRTLVPLSRSDQMFWEYLNYGLAVLGLFVVWLIRRWTTYWARRRYNLILNEGVQS
ncbi:MAG: Gldg family protein [Deltaproteobacteria bacterium]|nr:Gldg family protein [Deltaproteobacteria bacterium]